ncbi:hypothetical protein ERX37_07365 [Macrococcus hajekii]|uniref:DUF4181 domain-containing protein n=1 Tax=Macrococcus hajekii TaxID=198482 RepID=A0A4R6BJX9_9STAP|nr:hypothetical protein [Macrococcus hajekii]TDM02015.1 hypothetical protein ERX37_07365 [Macrococcus hajekii]GGB09372.1 hypothetical protein GCM10007190_16780 [Macrococcus hajekii]
MRKPDEMELHQSNQSIKLSWIFGMGMLLIISISHFVVNGNLSNSFLVMLSMLIVYRANMMMMQSKMGNNKIKPIVITMFLVFAICLILGLVYGYLS